MKPTPLLLFLCSIFSFYSAELKSQTLYYPPANEWEEVSPENVGLNSQRIKDAIQFAVENENSVERDLKIAILKGFSHEPYHQLAGPVKERGGPAGLIIKDGYIAAKWGDVDRVDMTFSVTKSYLSTVAGIAWDDGLLQHTDNPVHKYVWDRTFDGEHNQQITWHHLLQQTSDWYGTLFEMEDWSDRPPREGGIDGWRYRELHEPGTHFKYNDVRVNLLAYSLLQVLREPLPQVLKKQVMEPIGASTTWRWFGYGNSFVMVDGVNIQSVSGGGHNGGGLFINSMDHARFGLLFARNGEWKDNQIISREWIEKAVESSEVNPNYGYLWWLLKGNTEWKGVPDHVFYAAGFGGNYIIVDQKNDLVVVLRWMDSSMLPKLMTMIYDSVE